MSYFDRIQAIALANKSVYDDYDGDSGQINFLSGLVEEAAIFLKHYCNMSRYPDDLAGYYETGIVTISDFDASITNSFYIAVDGSAYYNCLPDFSTCVSGADYATAIKDSITAAISGDDSDPEENYLLENVTVTWSDTTNSFTFTSPTISHTSKVLVKGDSTLPVFSYHAKIGINNGAQAWYGSRKIEDLDYVAGNIVIRKYLNPDISKGALTSKTIGKFSASYGQVNINDLTKEDKSILQNYRRIRKP